MGYFIKLAQILKENKNIKIIAFYVHLLLLRKSEKEDEISARVNTK